MNMDEALAYVLLEILERREDLDEYFTRKDDEIENSFGSWENGEGEKKWS